jgi:hypothetical protein
MEVTAAIVFDRRATLYSVHTHSSPLPPLKAVPRNAEAGSDIIAVEDAEADAVDS